MKVARWGNSLAIRLPVGVVEALGLKEGDDVEIRAAGPHVLDATKTPDFEEVLARVRKYRGRMPPDFKFDRLEANDQE